MKQLYKLLLCAALTATALPAAGYDFKVDGICYNINADGKSVTVTYEQYPEKSNNNIAYLNASGSLVIPESVSYNGKAYSVTAIGSKAFHGCSGFKGSLTIPNSVTEIGGEAFAGCSGFTGSLSIPNSVIEIGGEAFSWCSGFIGSLTIGNSVTSIGYEAFYCCSGFMDSLTIGNSVTEIGGSAFAGCSGFTGSLTIPNSVTSIGSWAFSGCRGFTGSLTIPNSVTEIGGAAFHGCSGFTGSLMIGNSVTKIGDDAFDGCSGITDISIPLDLADIGGGAFNGTDWFNSQPNGVVYVGNVAYKYKGTIPQGSTLSLRDGIKGIAGSAFMGCSGFTGSLTIPNSVTTIGRYAFYNCLGFTGSLIIPNSVTTIGDYAFDNCLGFTGSLIIPNSVTSIGDYAFFGIHFGPSIIIPNSLTYIGYNAIAPTYKGLTEAIYASLILYGEGDFNLTSGSFRLSQSSTVYVQKGITSIKGLSLKLESSKIYSYAVSPPECDENVFSNNRSRVHVPKRSLAAYVDAPYWCNFTNIVADAIEPESLEWVQDSVTLNLGDQMPLHPILAPDNTGLNIQFTSSNPDVVSLSYEYDSSLRELVYKAMYGLQPGEADIIATCAWLEARLHVTVTDAVVTITLDKHEVEMEAGEMVTLTPSSSPVAVEYVATSSDRSVATARVADGRVQVVGAKPGTTVITVSDTEGKATPDTCRVTVVRPVGDINADGYVDVDDLNIVINIMVRKATLERWPAADLDDNGVVDVDDLNHVINIMIRKE